MRTIEHTILPSATAYCGSSISSSSSTHTGAILVLRSHVPEPVLVEREDSEPHLGKRGVGVGAAGDVLVEDVNGYPEGFWIWTGGEVGARGGCRGACFADQTCMFRVPRPWPRARSSIIVGGYLAGYGRSDESTFRKCCTVYDDMARWAHLALRFSRYLSGP